jgi:hypothetical protein
MVAAFASTNQTKELPMSNTALQKIREIKQYDDARPGFRGEHWLVLGAGVGAWLLSRRSASPVVRTLGLLAGTALVGRAASGRDGLSKVLRLTPVGRGIRL